ncbi:hypothetical protein BAY1663_02489 [Pseudomonas sp. BAY1663]|uniref:Uncharacterized protein n=1 Tax=Stutzerimonas stutzeri TaxID=316 RepID=A0A2N8T2D1_STUST|nr:MULTISPECIES: hypothetical protein [Pseudomonadaceae]EXF45081.1 hypothetical protein BAY1663_02489 [Pseudomonas sp. BAY1663]MCQ4326661.1 hypothetical protein [Stutzerimonas stutzeri]PNG08902.1 hypothetical protein CXK94_15485 [Stutzerimonas stutzeri]
MRVEGSYPIPYTTDRSARTGRAADGYGESQRVAQAQRGIDSRDGQDYQPQAERPQQRVNESALVERYAAFRYDDARPERSLPNHVAQALASYTTTASFSADLDANEVLGLDLYA